MLVFGASYFLSNVFIYHYFFTDYNIQIYIALKLFGSDFTAMITSCIFPQTEPLRVLMERYRETVPSSWHLQFLFDGVEVSESNTADELGLEDDDVIDVRVL
uniref:NFATC2-interacting protein n=1 Tax=Eptatretus burgeri TaxID=7764 RepID=A0A8C4QE38_EPTBU